MPAWNAANAADTPPVNLPAREVHIWYTPLTASPESLRQFHATLSPAEQDRAARFHFEHLRHAFTVSHGWLRALLARYTGTPPHEIEFTFGDKGKPAIHGSPVRFNLSHSGDLAACALTRDGEIGIDVERIRPMPDLVHIAERCFSLAEYRKLLSLPEDLRTRAFFRCWTRKEAYIKAIGDGLSAPLDRFEVTLGPDEPAQFLQIDGSRALAAEWSLFELPPSRGLPDDAYAGAVALRSSAANRPALRLMGP